MAAADPALSVEPPSVPRREAVPAAPLHWRGDVRIAEALPVVLDALAAVRQRDELRQLLPLLLDADAAPYRQRLAELLGSAASRSALHPMACMGARDATARVAPLPETPRTAAGAAWSLNLTRGNAQRWPIVWARHLPRWIDRAAALGVRHREWTDCDAFSGTRPGLLAMGIVRAGDFPGDAGRGLSMVTFAMDGMPKRKGEGATLRRAALRVAKSGRRFSVIVFPPAYVEDERRRALGLFTDRLGAAPAAGDDRAPQAIAQAGWRREVKHDTGSGMVETRGEWLVHPGDDECKRERKPAAQVLHLVHSRGAR